MLKKKATKTSRIETKKSPPAPAAAVTDKARPPRRRFIISSKSTAQPARAPAPAATVPDKQKKTVAPGKPAIKPLVKPEQNVAMTTQSSVDLTEVVKTLLHLSQENGYVTYDDINDVLPDNLSPDDLDELYTKLRTLDIEIVDQAEVDRAKPAVAEPEPDDDARLEILDDPVRMYMNQMGKVPLLTREQEVEICKKIEDAEIDMKRIVYSLGFAAKEHIAIAEKLLSEPPKERFDRVIVDKQVLNREKHLKNLRLLIKNIRLADSKVDAKFLSWRKLSTKNRRDKAQKEFLKLDKKLQAMFLKFFYKQKVVEEMIVVAGNVHEKFQSSVRRITELEGLHKSTARTAEIESEREKIATLELFVRMPREDFYKAFTDLKRPPTARNRPRPTWPRPTCASSFPSPRNTRTAASPSSI